MSEMNTYKYICRGGNSMSAPLSRRAFSDDQIKVQRLGYAYNAAGNVMDDSSFTASPIINMDRLKAAEAKYGLIISSERRHYTSLDIFSGNTLQEVGHSEFTFAKTVFSPKPGLQVAIRRTCSSSTSWRP